MNNAEIQLLRDIVNVMSGAQAAVIHAQYYRLASDIEDVLVRLGNIISKHNDRIYIDCLCSDSSHSCTASDHRDENSK